MTTPSARARCATIRLATDPTRVKLPASVEAIATTRARCGSGEVATNGFELFHQTPNAIGTGIGVAQSTGFNIGGIYDFTEHYHFLFSFGKRTSVCEEDE
jgi:hypothetical protein